MVWAAEDLGSSPEAIDNEDGLVLVPGAALPPGWRAPQPKGGPVHRALTGLYESVKGTFYDLSARSLGSPAPIALAINDRVEALSSGTAWPVRQQGRRGTCIAFAVAAAEELIRSQENAGGQIDPLSEEFLYYWMRDAWNDRRWPAGWTYNFSAAEAEKIDASGTTFLAQAYLILTTKGICSRTLLGYNNTASSLNHVESQASSTAFVTDAVTRKLNPSSLVWNIVKAPQSDISQTDNWVHPVGETRVSDLFKVKLNAGSPIAAAFALYGGNGRNAWSGALAEDYGRVEYPHQIQTDDYQPVAGHAVCIVGYKAHETRPDRVWFIFRNSLGEEFGRDVDESNAEPRPWANGYGMILSNDVDRYCWEYMFRASS